MSNGYPIITILTPELESPFDSTPGYVDQAAANPQPENSNSNQGELVPPPTVENGGAGSVPQDPATTIPESGVVFWLNETGQFANGYNYSNFGQTLVSVLNPHTLPSDFFQTVRVTDIPTSSFPGLGDVTSLPLTIAVSNDPRALGAFPMVPEPEVNCLLLVGMLVAGFRLMKKKRCWIV